MKINIQMINQQLNGKIMDTETLHQKMLNIGEMII